MLAASLPLLAAALSVAVARWTVLKTHATPVTAHVDSLLAHERTPVVLGIVNALSVWWWMGWFGDLAPVIQDEAAYLLQAELFARGRWVGVAPPLPEFFAQMHVFTTPVLASKYPPGTSLLLTPFVKLGVPVLGPLFLAGMSGGLVFTLARRCGVTAVALLTWVLWSTNPAVIRYQASFLSQTVTVPLWLATFYFVLSYRSHRRPRSLIAVGACVAALAITRPVTALAILPVAAVAVYTAWSVRAKKPAALAVLVSALILSILPVHNHRTTGDWRVSPLVVYTRSYAPFDLPGFGYDTRYVGAPLPPDLTATRDYLAEARRQHILAALPYTLRARVSAVVRELFSDWRGAFLLLAVVGVFVVAKEGLFALGASAGLIVAYAFHAHWPHWTVYYLEGYAAILFSAASGFAAVTTWMAAPARWTSKGLRLPVITPRAGIAAITAAVLLCTVGIVALMPHRHRWQQNISYQRRFVTALRIIEGVSPRSIVFIDYGRVDKPDLSLVWNVADLETARTWLAYHRGSDNFRLMRLAPERRAFIYRADEGRVTPLPPVTKLEQLSSSGRPNHGPGQ